jgi:exopolysaccharide biosynthesis polyprenyl glycosylphosphotransferase
MFARHNRLIGILYLSADLIIALVSFWLSHQIRSHIESLRPLYPVFYYPWIVPLAAAIWIGAGIATGIYREICEEELHRSFRDPLKVGIISTTLLFAIIFATKLVFVSRLLLGLYAAIDLILMTAFRLVARHFAAPLRRAIAGFRNFLLVGDGAEVLDIARTLEANESRGMQLFGFVRVKTPLPPEGVLNSAGLHRSYPVFTLTQFADLLRQHVIDEVIFSASKDDLEKLEETFLLCEQEGVKTRVLLSFFPHVSSRVYLERLGEKPLLTFSATPEDEHLLLLKRILDFVMAFVLLVLLSPLFLILTVLIRLTSHGPVLYEQIRCGLGGRKFTLYKFRSMRPDADLRREELEALNEMDGPAFKIKNDPRCTGIGKLMRKFSLDELPQLVNILRGDMSFVGPRPPLPEEVERYERWQRRRLRMQPGLTCLWALEGRSQLSFRRWMELDLQYIDNWSMSLDWKILLRTIPVVLLGRGAS